MTKHTFKESFHSVVQDQVKTSLLIWYKVHFVLLVSTNLTSVNYVKY